MFYGLQQKISQLHQYRQRFCYVLLGILSLLFILLLFYVNHHWENLPSSCIPNVVMECLCILILLMIFISIVRGGLNHHINVMFLKVVTLDVLYLFTDAIFWLIDGIPSLYFLNLIINTVYCLCPIFMGFDYWYIICEWMQDDPITFCFSTKAINILFALDTVLIIGNLWGGYYFTVSRETGLYERGAAYSFFIILPFFLLLISFIHILSKKMSVWDKLIFMVYPLLPYIITMETFYQTGPTLLPVGTFCSLFFLYCNLYVRREKELIQRERELTQSQLNSMLLQINPHFILNTLGSIDSLCVEDPSEAQTLLQLISKHLRNNYVDMVSEPLIPFQNELEHLQNYLSIEQVRFPNLKVEYDIRVQNFYIPSLSVQPLAENAVQHGICKRRKSAGTLKISSWETEEAYMICVSDDGVGFSGEIPNDNKSHIGIANVQKRLELLCGGSLEISSTPNKETRCLIILPKSGGGRIRHHHISKKP